MSHICSICGKSFSKLSNLTRHMKSIHEGNRHECPMCKKTFTRKYNLTNHIKSHKTESRPSHESRETVEQVSNVLILLSFYFIYIYIYIYIYIKDPSLSEWFFFSCLKSASTKVLSRPNRRL